MKTQNSSLLLIGALGALGSLGALVSSCATSVVTEMDAGAPVCKDAGNGQGEGCACDNKKYPRACFEGPTTALKPGTACKSGMRDCVNGLQTACVGQILPKTEVCNAADDDCDGVIDNISSDQPILIDLTDAGFAEAGVQCFVDSKQGLCAAGRYGCDMSGKQACLSILKERDQDAGEPPGVQDEQCNGLDDDCNGSTDDVPWLNETCQIDNKVGACGEGVHECVSGVERCRDLGNKPKAETCNKKDDNCNGQVDEGANICPNGQVCVNGTCQFWFCPHVFSFDGQKFKYETTVGGASLIGKEKHLKDGRDIAFAPMWSRLDAAKIDASGSVRAKVLAAEDEIVYVDHARLSVVAHAPGHEVISSSAIDYKSWPNHTDPQVFWAMRSSAMRAPKSASWMGTTDVTRELAKADDHAAAFDPKQDNFYELDFGAITSKSAWLVLDGWKYKFKRGLPESVKQQHPRLEVLGADGAWHKAMDLGNPRGDRKTIAFDLTGVKWTEGRYHVRIYTGTHESKLAAWYLDSARLTEEAPSTPAVTHLGAAVANLDFSGAPTVVDENNHAHSLWSFDDGKGELTDEMRTFGRFTKYGDVRPLVSASDDRLVVMRRGDALELRFDGVKKPAPGQELALMLETELLFKPRAYLGEKRGTPITENVAPMPFHAMGHYPPAAAPSDADEDYAKYMDTWQTRVYTPADHRWGK